MAGFMSGGGWQTPPPEDMMKLQMLSQGAQGLASIINQRAGGAPIQPTPMPDPMQIARFQQMQKAQAEREQAKAAIQQLPNVPEEVRTLMSLYPEEAISPYIKSQFRDEPRFMSTAGGLYDVQQGGIVPGTQSNAGGRPILRDQHVGDDMMQTMAIDPQTLQAQPLGDPYPRWRDRVGPSGGSGGAGGGGGAGGKPLAGQLRTMDRLVTMPDGSQQIVQDSFYVQNQRGGPPKVVPFQMPGVPENVTGRVKREIDNAPDLTTQQRNELTQIDQQAAAVDDVLKTIEQQPSAFDRKKAVKVEAAGMLGEIPRSLVESRTFTEQETEARTGVYNQVSGVIKDRIGAAQTESERKDLRAFLPGPTDDVKQIRAKFNGYQKWLAGQKAQIKPAKESLAAQPVITPPNMQNAPLLAPPGPASITRQQPAAKIAPPVGTVRGKLKFAGGDPANPASWVPK